MKYEFKITSKDFKNGYLSLIILMLISLVAGLDMMISPETVNHWVIRGVGLVWTMEAISYALKIVKKYYKNERTSNNSNSKSNNKI